MAKKNKTIDDLAIMMVKRFGELDEKINNTVTKTEFNEMKNSIDGLTKKVTDFQAELASNQIAHDRMQKYIESLDKRITKVELRTGIRTK